jgi:mRNA interferase MazF
MIKDYKDWHSKKTGINDISTRPSFHEREIWTCYLGSNIGFEQDGSGEDYLRPVLIIRKFNNDIFWAIPLTNTKKESEHYFTFSFIEGQTSTAILSQIRLIDAKRLGYKIGYISEIDFPLIKEKLKALLP